MKNGGTNERGDDRFLRLQARRFLFYSGTFKERFMKVERTNIIEYCPMRNNLPKITG